MSGAYKSLRLTARARARVCVCVCVYVRAHVRACYLFYITNINYNVKCTVVYSMRQCNYFILDVVCVCVCVCACVRARVAHAVCFILQI